MNTTQCYLTTRQSPHDPLIKNTIFWSLVRNLIKVDMRGPNAKRSSHSIRPTHSLLRGQRHEEPQSHNSTSFPPSRSSDRPPGGSTANDGYPASSYGICVVALSRTEFLCEALARTINFSILSGGATKDRDGYKSYEGIWKKVSVLTFPQNNFHTFSISLSR